MKYILIAEDEPLNQLIFQEILEENYELEITENGNDCLNSINKRIPDLLLLDVGLPDIDGMEICRRLRAMNKTQHMPIFLVSGYSSAGDKKSGLDAGANKYISKPFVVIDFLSDVKSTLDE